MRLTLPVCKWSMQFARKRLWNSRGFVKVKPEPIHWYLQGHGLDPNKEPDLTTGFNHAYDSDDKPIAYVDRLFDFKRAEETKNYHANYVHEYDYNTKLMEGLNQACILTKTKAVHELPQKLLYDVGIVELSNQDELMQRYIMQANLWDTTKDKLPRRLNKSLPGWKFKAEYGIPQRRIRSILMQNIVRLCRTIGGQYPDLLHSRTFLQDPYVSVSYTHLDEKPIIIRGVQDWLMTSTRPLELLATTEEVEETISHEMPDMFPVLPTISLRVQHIYQEGENITGYSPGSITSHPHTLFTMTKTNLSLEMQQTKVLMYCFAHCLATAKAKYGSDVTRLPEPITLQCIQTDGITFNFACFQLNTLDFSTTDGVKNLIWFESEGSHAMYNKILPNRAMLRNTIYEDYDPGVLRKILAFYIAGAKLDSTMEHIESLA